MNSLQSFFLITCLFFLTTSYQITTPPSLENFCTKNTTSFSLEPVEFQPKATSCFMGTFKHVKIFAFKAKTPFLDFTLKTADGLQSIKDPVLYLMDEQYNVIHCNMQKNNEISVGLFYEKLEKKKTYLIGVFTSYKFNKAFLYL